VGHKSILYSHFLYTLVLQSICCTAKYRTGIGLGVSYLSVVVTQPKSAVGHKSILSSLWFTFLQEGVYLLLTVLYTEQALATGVPSFLFICGGHKTKICGGSQIYIIFSLVYILARGCLLSFTVYRTGVCYRASKFLIFLWWSRNQNLPRVTNLYYYLLSGLHSSPRVSTVCLQYTEQVLATGVPSFLFICGGHETKIYFSRQSGASTKTKRNLSRPFVYICIVYLKE
jgi:hypothetical protein